MRIWCIVWLLVLCGCDIFSTREAQDPTETAQWHTFTVTPGMVLDNLEFAFEEPQNLSRYQEILTGDFRFEFDLQDVNQYGTPIQWDRDTETEALGLLYSGIGEETEIQVELLEIAGEPDVIMTGYAEIHREYTIDLSPPPEGSDGLFHGRMFLYIVEQEGFWRIGIWSDERDQESSPTWGKLKFDYAPSRKLGNAYESIVSGSDSGSGR